MVNKYLEAGAFAAVRADDGRRGVIVVLPDVVWSDPNFCSAIFVAESEIKQAITEAQLDEDPEFAEAISHAWAERDFD